ncbi:MAG: Hpt domain-containing protein [Pseudanabaenaceae cyanobacterium SKYGB_i_bin29]|nr:Hpt domain-containing protein [Pseudanabaenaceae cyanobacterium SKYG29]MDW8422147.1 Hpt domain-containing protein [Pseudanabaenaceae cyanobacterium SKYGB_i_bin29]
MFTIDPELWTLFVEDNAKCLRSYSRTAENIDRANWRESIQQLYRDAHTIKGGAATIGAEEILTTAKAIENVLAELRYLQEAPPNLETELKGVLIELGEILRQTVENQHPDPFAQERIQSLHEFVQERCLGDWDEERQLHQEFADQGFDLMVLDLQMAIEDLPQEIPESIVELALTTMEQLLDVGDEIKLGDGWRLLIQRGMELAISRSRDLWLEEFPRLLAQMKTSARGGGKTMPQEKEFSIVTPASTGLGDLSTAEGEGVTILPVEEDDLPTGFSDLFALPEEEQEITILPVEEDDLPTGFGNLFAVEEEGEEEQKQLESLFAAAVPIETVEEQEIPAEIEGLFTEEVGEIPVDLASSLEEVSPTVVAEAAPATTGQETVIFTPPVEPDSPVDPELRALFDMDTQKYLQVYFSTVEQLNPETWKKDIQQIYRAIHTIKGGAATVGANPILQVAKVLEDWLSDLRSMEDPPTIDDNLRDSLLECGELLIATLSMGSREQPTASVEQISRLHANFKQQYAEQLSEEVLMQKEFAEQGFDLMVLDLEMCVEGLRPNQTIDAEMISANQGVLQQLADIGRELKLSGDWDRLIEEGMGILGRGHVAEWLEQIPSLLKSLKTAAKHGGKLPQAATPPRLKPDLPPISTVTTVDPELKALFDVDTQKYLQEYFATVEAISPDTWKTDIQKLYRAIHTIKGGAATVGANPILQVAKVLEDWLSDLRNLDEAPPLENLRSGLLESGELLIGTLQMDYSTVPLAAVERIFDLHQTFKESYKEELDETVLLHREFADQGFDLMVLDLEMLIEQLTPETAITPEMQTTATQCLEQLAEVGTEIGLAEGWTKLLLEGKGIIANASAKAWQEQFPPYLKSLKECARRSGKLPEPPKPVEAPPPTEQPKPPEPAVADIQIPVPLERLDRSAQYLVETLMATRATQGFYQIVQKNLIPIVTLAQESAQYISRLREVQDDFAVLDSDGIRGEGGVKLERYRQGYTAINRLLETTLRLIELGSETGEAARRTSESLMRLEQSLRNLQGTVEESRLVPFESLAFRARGILRDLTTRMNKPARLYVVGEKLELDAGTLRNLEPVLLHLIRNSFDHGLEPPEEREKLGKPRQGRIDLSLLRRGSVFVLELKDDGRGINPEKIRSIAESKGLPLTDTSTNEKLLAVICQPGFTSAKTVSDISGRGVGMDVVASQIAAMGGQLSLKTKVGVGTTFTMQIPVPNLFVRCMLLQTGDRTFAVPTAEVFTTMLLDDLLWRPVPPAENRLYSYEIEEDRGQVPALDLFQYWQGDRNPRHILPNAIAVRAKRSDSTDGIWLIADNLVGQSELLVNSLPAPMVSPIGILGVSLMPDGKLIPVIDANALMDALLGNLTEDGLPMISAHVAETETLEEEGIQIVVVDDAALMRRRIESSLTPQGYKVITCNDGLEAWEWLQSHPQPALLITDIEMPNMDGFTLIDHCRQAKMTMPILVVSSRLAEEWSRETRRLGATDFLTKGFGTTELLEKVAKLLEQSVGV